MRFVDISRWSLQNNGHCFGLFVKKLDDFHEYFVYADSWYGSEELALQLHKLGFWFTIACKSNNPSYLFSQYLHLDGPKKHIVSELQAENSNLRSLHYHSMITRFAISYRINLEQ